MAAVLEPLSLIQDLLIFFFSSVTLIIFPFSTIQAQQSESVHQYSILYHSTALVLLTCLQPGHEHYVHDLLSTVLFHTAFLA